MSANFPFQAYFNAKVRDELIAHPELNGLESDAAKDGSAASSATPQPPPTRIKLVGLGQSNGANGNSAGPKDEDE
jgi:hypothetical protein